MDTEVWVVLVSTEDVGVEGVYLSRYEAQEAAYRISDLSGWDTEIIMQRSTLYDSDAGRAPWHKDEA